MFFNSRKSITRNTARTNIHAGAAVSTRVVSDRRWVHRNQLELGMYVNELDKPWEDTNFMFQGFTIDSYETLRAVQNVCEYANVQTEKLAMVSANSLHRLTAATRDSGSRR